MRTCERDLALASSTSALWLRGHVPESTRRMLSSTVVMVSSELGPVGSGRLRFREMIGVAVPPGCTLRHAHPFGTSFACLDGTGGNRRITSRRSFSGKPEKAAALFEKEGRKKEDEGRGDRGEYTADLANVAYVRLAFRGILTRRSSRRARAGARRKRDGWDALTQFCKLCGASHMQSARFSIGLR